MNKLWEEIYEVKIKQNLKKKTIQNNRTNILFDLRIKNSSS